MSSGTDGNAKRKETAVSPQKRMRVFCSAVIGALALAIIGVLYLAGHFIPAGVHNFHALLAFALAGVALVVANFTRPSGSALG